MVVSLKDNNWFFVMDQTPHTYPTRSLTAQFTVVSVKSNNWDIRSLALMVLNLIAALIKNKNNVLPLRRDLVVSSPSGCVTFRGEGW
jgi:hypothetical protein